MNNQHYGLYRPEFEHDACGIGFYADIKGRASHKIITTALEMLRRLDHRAGKNADGTTSDGAGISMQIPHAFFEAVCSFTLPKKGEYAVGMLFLPHDPHAAEDILNEFRIQAASLGLSVPGVREVPVNPEVLGRQAEESRPHIVQIFVSSSSNDNTEEAVFQRKIYILRKLVENKFGSSFYAASFSNRTIVYKGMVSAEQLPLFYTDLADERFQSALALIHSRFSTNTFPSWERAHPNRMIAHNGEINTIKGNVNWFNAKIELFANELDLGTLKKIQPVINKNGSDSAIFDNVLEFLTTNGISLPHAIMMMVPEPWEDNEDLPPYLKSFYEYHSQIMEPWDGPMALEFTNGKQIGAVLDRNGLRPARYYITHDDKIIFASEVGVVDVEPENVKERRHLKPGQLLFVDLEKGALIPSDELKAQVSLEKPYAEHLEDSVIDLEESHFIPAASSLEKNELAYWQTLFGYTYEECTKSIVPMAQEKNEPIGAMGVDTPIAVLSERPQLLFHYFKQSFSQVTNPPIDSIREAYVISTVTWLGPQVSLDGHDDTAHKKIRLEHPFLSTAKFNAILNQGMKTAFLPAYHSPDISLDQALEQLLREADEKIGEGAEILILSDRAQGHRAVPIPSLLAVSALHQHMIRSGTRPKASIVLDSGEPRDSHHMAALLGYGADAVHPYLALETIQNLIGEGHIDLPYKKASENYLTTLKKSVVKIMSKVGITTMQSYRGAQTFEALGIAESVCDRYFTGTVSQLGGIGLAEIGQESLKRFEKAQKLLFQHNKALDPGSELQWRKDGEYHLFNPQMMYTLQQATRTNNKELYRKFSETYHHGPYATIRSLLAIESNRKPVPLDEVEPVESIWKRFKTGAMSYGALSKEAHEALAIAMNRIGGKSNSGEGGEEKERYTPDANGDSRRSAIKQVASGRFGVTSLYLTDADEIQIKMAQGAKPGEGGQLPGSKVYPWIAEVRGSTPGVGLISPPPHHDIYSIEDLAQLIYDLKSANPRARISVKLVAKSGVGTIAAGVAKGLADTILISGHDGGTGASPQTSIKHAGMPWELGLAETHQTLTLNGLRDRVVLETDGKLMTGRDVVIAACLGAEEFGFSTAPLVVLGCIMMRACHLDTCPVGVATQNPKLRAKFMGKPEYVVNYMRFIAEEVREILAECGYRSLDELVGETGLLKVKDEVKNHWKAKQLHFDKLLFKAGDTPFAVQGKTAQSHKLEERFDSRELNHLSVSVRNRQQTAVTLPVRNTDRAIGTTLGHIITKTYGDEGLPEDFIHIHLHGSAGQSLGAFIPKGLTLNLEGDANDYVGKGLSGGKIVVKPGAGWSRDEEQAIIGNIAFFGATSGEAYIRGTAGQRFCVRNSGVHAVVEGIGDHGCEYMTGGRVAVLGPIGKNFAAGMSGGIAYIYTGAMGEDEVLSRINQELVSIEGVDSDEDMRELYHMIQKHYQYTGSPVAKRILKNWELALHQFVKIVPREYKAMMELIQYFLDQQMPLDEARLAAFEYKKSGKHLPEIEKEKAFPTEVK
ncbi:glutamate synthase large subunit [Heyndrickxia coagulans]|uniref:Glutamate synthase (NADPH/NADH) large chain n=3 Tax=Heyndrickxia coagulans TaxID=1398 RepID=A0A8B4BTU3_HEYCO|nr:glutamate synthase large subunit [Heyndrickxia coagulans]AJH77285.1 glutamine amidotransferases class-II family protein [Heyndrickxia coagulans DSM 1 = ATCC 7050]MCR2845790.1 glutamate synthase large subunit [Heyndrickxia coagulans]MDR4223405.1 glutamate synthase large subunit [Heyndrickxia coagulans DSM 1 = ATCC 7050]MED4494572.1 glutamate synthase large subunit [Heyndrickxia coagulans]QJE32552.1 glutamate synthase large subunit [Heyndrickxia coagulans]